MKRLLGIVVGAEPCPLGAYAVLGGRGLPDPGGRVLWYGITLIVVGLLAIASAWYVDDVDPNLVPPPAATVARATPRRPVPTASHRMDRASSRRQGAGRPVNVDRLRFAPLIAADFQAAFLSPP